MENWPGTQWFAAEISNFVYLEVVKQSSYLHRDKLIAMCQKEYEVNRKVSFPQRLFAKFVSQAKTAKFGPRGVHKLTAASSRGKHIVHCCSFPL